MKCFGDAQGSVPGFKLQKHRSRHKRRKAQSSKIRRRHSPDCAVSKELQQQIYQLKAAGNKVGLKMTKMIDEGESRVQ